jgi:hypothetical protein
MTLPRNLVPGRVVILSLLVLLVWMPGIPTAQGTVTWSEPFNVSNSPTSSNHPAIVADAYGYVHAFWSENMDGETIRADQLATQGNMILYRRWDEQAWSEPVDILAVAGDTLADFPAAMVDSNNRLHLVWTGLTRQYYSSAPAAEAYSPRAWSRPETFSWGSARSRWESDAAVDGEGKVHIAYAERGEWAGVFHNMAPAEDRGATIKIYSLVGVPVAPREEAGRAGRGLD